MPSFARPRAWPASSNPTNARPKPSARPCSKSYTIHPTSKPPNGSNQRYNLSPTWTMLYLCSNASQLIEPHSYHLPFKQQTTAFRSRLLLRDAYLVRKLNRHLGIPFCRVRDLFRVCPQRLIPAPERIPVRIVPHIPFQPLLLTPA